MFTQKRNALQCSPFITSAALLVLVPVLIILFSMSVHAQTEVTGAIEGIVTERGDASKPIANATVQIINLDTQVQTATRTDASGRFIRNQLPPGNYQVKVHANNYQEYLSRTQRVDVTLTNRAVPIPIGLEPVAVASTGPSPSVSPSPGTDVATTSPSPSPSPLPSPTGSASNTDEVAAINRTDGRRGGGFRENEVSTLPLGGTTLVRTFDELALLLPGVALPPQTQGDVAGPGVGPGVGSSGQFAVNGIRSRSNNFTVDGSDNNDEDIGVRRQGFLALVPQPIESIREYRVITLLAPAQFGRNIGAQVNAVSKSGSNGTHGTVFGFFNSSQLNARNTFDTANGNAVFPVRSVTGQSVLSCADVSLALINNSVASTCISPQTITASNQSGGKDSFTLGQGGFAFGGPLVPGKQFYFVSAEGHIMNATKEESFRVPTVDQRGAFNQGATGLFVNPVAGTADLGYPTTFQSDAVFSLFPFANNPNGIYGNNTFTEVLPAGGQSKIASGKYDVNGSFHGKVQTFTARYNFTDDWRDISQTGGALFSTLRPRVRTQNFSTFWNSELSSPASTKPVFNELRLSYGRTRLIFDEVRDQQFQIPSQIHPNTPFLLNARFLSNNTINPNFGVRNTGPVLYVRGGTTECGFVRCPGFNDEGALGPLGQVKIAGFSPIGVDVFNFPQKRVNNTYQLADTVTWRNGHHSFAFGADMRRTELNSDLERNARTLVTFNGAPQLRFDQNPNTGALTNFRFSGFIRPENLAAASAASGEFTTLATGDATIHLRYYQLNYFGQDEWRVTPNLSISYGLRYEYNTPPREVNKLIENTFSSSAIAQLIPNLSRFIDGRTGIYDPDKNNFEPRIGIAYSPHWFGPDRTTVIRAGYGLYYDQILGAVVSQSRNVFPRFLTLNTPGGLGSVNGDPFSIFNIASPNNGIRLANGTFVPYTLPGSLNTLNPALPLSTVVDVNNREFSQGGFAVTLPARQLDMPAAHQFAATFEQQLTSNTVLSVGYVGTIGRQLLRSTTPNLGPNALLLPLFYDSSNLVPEVSGVALAPGSRVTSAGLVTGGRPVSGVGSVNIFETDGRSRYNALQVQVRGRLHLLGTSNYQVGYTFSEAKDDASDVFDLAGSYALPQNSIATSGEYADSNFDARHRISYYYITDALNFKNQTMHAIFGNIQVASSGQFQTGQPFTVNSVFDVNLDGNLTDRLNSTSGIQVTGDRSQPLRLTVSDPTTLLAPIGSDGSVPRNSFRSGNIWTTNMAVIKTIPFNERFKMLVRMEVFNLWNRANYGIPVRLLEVPEFGRAIDTVTPGRRIQFAMKLLF